MNIEETIIETIAKGYILIEQFCIFIKRKFIKLKNIIKYGR